jgi:hypothetical protein
MPASRIIDGRDMVPPEPLELTVAALDTLADEDELILLLHCEPHPLYTILQARGYRHHSELRSDGTNEIRICRIPVAAG